MEAVISKWGNSSALRLPKTILQKLGIKDNDTVKLDVRDNAIFIEKVIKERSLRDLIMDETGQTLTHYVEANPYDTAAYIEFGNAGGEEI
ncbi:MAG: AbrB/MazE/SpoVT family DNA-binding domain-containing protein [Defluviitaleaceae bacterium]|nr:AbrB/MazE/SpoVT family DNA-binding domain-containing protein [Defluviitaleaceae bacterium]